MNHELTDQDIISGIKDEPSRDRTLFAVFRLLDWQGAAIAFVRQRGGAEEDGKEVAQHALIAFDRNIRNDRYEGRSSLKTYFLAIVKFQWLKHLERNKERPLPQPELLEAEEESVEVAYISEEYRQTFSEALAQIGGRCKKILELYMLDISMEEIAKAMNLANADMAKKAAYRCRMNFREFLQNHPDWLNRLNKEL